MELIESVYTDDSEVIMGIGNVPGVLNQINPQLSKHTIIITGRYLKTNDQIGYVVLVVDRGRSKKSVQLLKEVKETIKVRIVY